MSLLVILKMFTLVADIYERIQKISNYLRRKFTSCIIILE